MKHEKPKRTPPQSKLFFSGIDMVRMVQEHRQLEEFTELLIKPRIRKMFNLPDDAPLDNIHPVLFAVVSNQLLYEMQLRMSRTFVECGQ
jgi:hypothetical protein